MLRKKTIRSAIWQAFSDARSALVMIRFMAKATGTLRWDGYRKPVLHSIREHHNAFSIELVYGPAWKEDFPLLAVWGAELRAEALRKKSRAGEEAPALRIAPCEGGIVNHMQV